MNQQEAMKKQILKSIAQIQKVAKATGMNGEVQLHFSGIHPDEWDAVLASITEYPMYRHYVDLGNKFQVVLLLD